MYILLSDEAEEMVRDLIAVGVHGSSIDEVATRLVEDQLKRLMETPGWSELFERKRRVREQMEMPVIAPAPTDHDANCRCDRCIPF